MKFVDHYRILGVKKTATMNDIRKAYLELAKLHHPDRGGSESKMHKINEAYEVLKEPKARELYDQIHAAKYSSDGSLNMYFTEMMSDASTRHRMLELATKLSRLYLLSAAGLVLIIILMYAKTSTSFYLVLIAPAAYCAIQFFRGINTVLKIKIKHAIKIGSKKITPSWQRIGLLTITFLLSLMILGLSFAWASRTRENRTSSGTAEQTVIFENELRLISESRDSYDECIKDFNDLTTRLSKLNQELENAQSLSDNVNYDRYKAERELTIVQFDAKREECAKLQSLYNERLENYRQKSTTE